MVTAERRHKLDQLEGASPAGGRGYRSQHVPSRERRCARREDVREGLCRGGGCGAGDLLQRASHEWTRGDVEEESAPGCGLGLARRPRLGDGRRRGHAVKAEPGTAVALAGDGAVGPLARVEVDALGL